ncbi:hypothetical protein GX50_07970 [[Emmonsia] crescens]|uniref:Cyclin-D1-binding protein 1-like N-terminal domain-containing protein n=1 Tax=[Emmonsia] crescens TaxID=73230 RepID=A0A2B7Z806_9EURO|nr:hypothetical protein GX50_07970 [Emmonsia crescens]
MPPTLPSVLEATLILTGQFNSTLSTPLPPSESQSTTNNHPAPLSLLSTSATALKAQTTKLSLLAINTPFTPSALITVLTTVNESILPSLVTAALLAIPAEYTRAFHAEAKLLVKDALREFGSLVGVVKVIAGGAGSGDKGKGEGKATVTVTEQQKGEVMTCTGRVWKACEQLVSFAEEGVVGFVAGKARQYLELVRDGIRELEEWDPEEDGDDDEDDPFWDDGDELGGKGDEGTGKDKGMGKADDESNDEDTTIASLQSEKSHLLRLLNPISQIYPAIISHRLKKKTFSSSTSKDQRKHQHGLSQTEISQLDRLLPHLRELPNLVDEAAGSLYDHDIDNTVMYTMQLRKCAFAAAEAVRLPLIDNSHGNGDNMSGNEGGGEKGEKKVAGEEDKFPKWADTWMRVIEEIAKSRS